MAAKQGKKQRKFGRNKPYCEAYARAGKAVLSKARQMAKHIERYGTTDHKAVHAYNNLPELVKKQIGERSFTPTKSQHKRKPPAFWGVAMGGNEALARSIIRNRQE